MLEVLEKKTATLAKDDPSLAHTKNNLALLYQAERAYDMAEPLFRECLAVWGVDSDHPDALAVVGNLGAVLYALKRYRAVLHC